MRAALAVDHHFRKILVIPEEYPLSPRIMPLYRKRPKKTFLSQDVLTQKTLSPFKEPNPSQASVEDVLGSHESLKSPIYPEVFPRTASVPNESASDNLKNEEKLGGATREKEVFQNVSESKMENSGVPITYINGSEIVSIETKENSSTIEKFSPTKEEKKKNNVKKSSKKKQSDVKNKNTKKIKLSDSRDEKSNEDIFPQKDPDISFNSSVSSQISMNHPEVKEAFKNFMIQKETKRKNISSQNSDISLNDPIIREAYTQFLTRKEKFSRVNTPKGLTHYDKMKWLQEQRLVGVYVQCDKCDKIRYLQDIQDPTLLPDKWYCKDNTDKEFNNCEIPEEKFPAHIQEDWIDNLYNAGSIVWGRVEGYPWWPAMVDDDPNTESYYWLENEINNTPSYYHVTFFDKKEVTRAWLKPHEIKSFYKERTNTKLLPSKFSIFKERIDFAIKQADKALDMSLKERLEKFSFLTRYHKPINKPRDVTKELERKNRKSKSEKVKRSKETNGGKTNKNKKKFQSSDFLMSDFEVPTSPAIDDLSFDIFEDF